MAWTGTWVGGQIADGDTYYIAKMVKGRRFTFCLGACGPKKAKSELARFADDPHSYQTPAVRDEVAAQLRDDADEAKRAGAVVVTSTLIEAFETALSEGYENRKGRTPDHVDDVLRYLAGWFVKNPKSKTDGPLMGRDLRAVTGPQLHDALDGWKTAKQKRIASLKSFTAFLKFRGLLTAGNDPTVNVKCLQSRKPTKDEIREKVYAPATLAAHYKQMDRQWCRDVIAIRVKTGMHVSEIEKFIERGGLMPVTDAGEIAGIVLFDHKNGDEHSQCVDAQTFHALVRLKKAGRIPKRPRFVNCLERAAERVREETADPKEASKVERIVIANLRATFVTLGQEQGRLVYLPKKQGVPLEIMAQVVGHRSTVTTRTYYDGTTAQPLIYMEGLTLFHPNDPVNGKRHLQAVV